MRSEDAMLAIRRLGGALKGNMRWFKKALYGLLLLLAVIGCGYPVARAQSCCGPITAEGQRLTSFLDNSGVDHLWMAGWHVDWKTGQVDRPEPGGAKTHCSAFVAAMADRVGVYILRPPEHPQNLLANAQMRWLAHDGAGSGWRPAAGPVEAQGLANKGMLVVAAYENPDSQRPGHIAIIHPSLKALDELQREGPQETQAGATNARSTTIALGFRHHPGAWESGGAGTIRYYVHSVDWDRIE
jgi:hypothetical protein